jgi:hypothetical protein
MREFPGKDLIRETMLDLYYEIDIPFISLIDRAHQKEILKGIKRRVQKTS